MDVAAGSAQRRNCAYVGAMNTFLLVLLLATMLAVLGVLGAGMLGMVRGLDAARSNRLMRWRVLLQGLALVLFALLLATKR